MGGKNTKCQKHVAADSFIAPKLAQTLHMFNLSVSPHPLRADGFL